MKNQKLIRKVYVRMEFQHGDKVGFVHGEFDRDTFLNPLAVRMILDDAINRFIANPPAPGANDLQSVMITGEA